MHSFEDIGQSPMLRHRFKSCHQCEGCMLGDAPSELSFESGANAEMAMTRSGVERKGEDMAATVDAEAFIAIELANCQEPYLIARVIRPMEIYRDNRRREYMGWMQPGDKVIYVQAYRGSGPILTPTSKRFFCFAGDVRVVQLEVEEIAQRASSRVAAMEASSMMGGANVTYRLADGERLKIVKCLPLEDPSPRWSGEFQG